MSYTTLYFFAFILAAVVIYYIFPVKKYQWTVLLAASIFFYCYADFRYAFFIVFTSFTTWIAALQTEKIKAASKAELALKKGEWDREQKKIFKKKTKHRTGMLLFLTLAANFGILIFLKYYNFTAGGLNAILGWSGFSAPMLRLFLPLGISFYTFQSMGYVIDVYRGNAEAEKNFLKFALFISFFPQTIQGPISSFNQLAHQLFEPHRPEYLRFKYGLELMLWGYLKKLVIADRAVTAIHAVTADYKLYNGTTILFTVLLYALQLYADFSGGIDISRGIAQMLGIDMVENFRRPYMSKSINEYWRRWHITLGVWMKNYIFYPLAVSKTFLNASKKMHESRFGKTAVGEHIAKVFPTSVASLIVFLVVGLWHGANSRYVAFGVWNGLIIMISIILQPLYKKWIKALRINAQSHLWHFFQIIRTFILVLVGYMFDIGPNFTGSMDMLRMCFTDQNLQRGMFQMSGLGLYIHDYAVLAVGAIVILIVSLRQEKLSIDSPGVLLARHSAAFQWAMLFIAVVTVVSLGIYGPDYNAASFVYMQF